MMYEGIVATCASCGVRYNVGQRRLCILDVLTRHRVHGTEVLASGR